MSLRSAFKAPHTAIKRMSVSFIQRGGLWVVVQFVLMIAVIVLGVVLRGSGWGGALIASGIALFGLGAIFGIAGAVALGRNRTPFPRPRVNSKLIQHGIYARVRHPLYTSVMLISLGWALLWQSASALVAALVLIPFFHATKPGARSGGCAKHFPAMPITLNACRVFCPSGERAVSIFVTFDSAATQ